MKRKLPLIIALTLVMAFMVIGCSSLGRITPFAGTQDTSYIVLSNGGSAVQYGNYVYFINGYNDYADIDGKANVFNKVEKGAIYRAKLLGRDVDRKFDLASGSVTKKTFEPLRSTRGLFFDTVKGEGKLLGYQQDASGNYIKNDKDEYIEIRDEKIGVEIPTVQKIGPKKIGTTGFADGGIFIFDDYIFYASPNNTKDRSGSVQTHKTDFFRAKLDGSKTELIYTSEKDTASSAYMFYKFNGNYYLVVLDGDTVKSVKMDNKIRDAITIGEGVTDVHFPNKGTYYTGMPENTTDDLVYILRKPVRTDDYSDTTLLGNVLEAKRPDGSDSTVIAGVGKTSTILGSNNGMFFYRIDNSIYYTNLAGLVKGQGENQISDNMDFDASDYTSVKCINPNPKNAEDVYVLGMSGEGLFLTDRMGNERQLYNVTSTLVAVEGSYVYFTSGVQNESGTVNKLLRINMFVVGAQPEEVLNVDSVNTSATFKYDILYDFVMYFADIDSDAKAYAHFKELSDMSAEGVFIGYRTEADTVSEESLYPPEED